MKERKGMRRREQRDTGKKNGKGNAENIAGREIDKKESKYKEKQNTGK